MSSDSNIEWTDATWNPSTGCTQISRGCDHCYAAPMARRIQASEQARIDKLAKARDAALKLGDGVEGHRLQAELDELAQRRLYGAGFGFTEHTDKLELMLAPLRWKKPRRVFTCSMSDLFHETASEAHLDRVWAVMAACPQHTFQVLTKRPHRMAEYLRVLYGNNAEAQRRRKEAIRWVIQSADAAGIKSHRKTDDLGGAVYWLTYCKDSGGPVLPNVWLGTSVESQEVCQPGWHRGLAGKWGGSEDLTTEDTESTEKKQGQGDAEQRDPRAANAPAQRQTAEPSGEAATQPVPGRIDALLQCPAPVRFLSCEPLLGPLDLSAWLAPGLSEECGVGRLEEELQTPNSNLQPDKLHWVIAGGESGHKARPCHPDWIRSLRDQCQAAGVAFFFKQWGKWAPLKQGCLTAEAEAALLPKAKCDSLLNQRGYFATADEDTNEGHLHWLAEGVLMAPTTKDRAGRLLDGVEHSAYPEVLR